MLHLINGNSSKGSGYAIFLSGDELNEVRPLIKDVPHIDNGNVIEFSNLDFKTLCDVLVDYEITSSSKVVLKKLKENKPPIMKMKDNVVAPKFKLQPRQHQIEAVRYGLEKGKFLLGDEMGKQPSPLIVAIQ